MTGLSQQQLDLLIDRVADQVGTWQPARGRHRTLDLATAVTMTLVWLRHNLSQALLGAFHGISRADRLPDHWQAARADRRDPGG